MSLKKIALWSLIVSVAISALLGMLIVLLGSFNEIQVRVILTTLTISAASICALACGALWESQRSKFLPLAGVILSVVTAILFIAGIWARINNEEFWKLSASIGLVAVATAHVCLLSLARLSGKFAVTRLAAFIAVYTLAAQFIYLIYQSPTGNRFIRFVGATSIIVAALSILMPLLHRLSRAEIEEGGLGAAETLRFATITCPQCGAQGKNSEDEITCASCGCRFTIRIIAAGHNIVTANQL